MRGLLALGGLAALVACSQGGDEPQPPSSPPTSTVKGPNFQGSIAISPSFQSTEGQGLVRVDVALQPGFHVYTTGESIGRPIGLELRDSPGWTAGDAVHPEGKRKTTALGTSVVLEGQFRSELPVHPEDTAGDELKGRFRYQVCTETACDRPRSLDFELEAPSRS